MTNGSCFEKNIKQYSSLIIYNKYLVVLNIRFCHIEVARTLVFQGLIWYATILWSHIFFFRSFLLALNLPFSLKKRRSIELSVFLIIFCQSCWARERPRRIILSLIEECSTWFSSRSDTQCRSDSLKFILSKGRSIKPQIIFVVCCIIINTI